MPPSGGTVTASAAIGTFSETFPAGVLATSAPVTLCYIPQASLPAPLLRARFVHFDRARRPNFTQGAGNTYIAAFITGFGGVTLSGSAGLSGTGGIVPASIPAGTQLNIAVLASNTWSDVGTASVGTGGSFASSIPTASLPGVNAAGTYLVYEPAQGTTVAALNLGFALVADDGSAFLTSGLQFVQIEDPSGNALPTPTTTFFPIAAGDLDGQSLTPDAQHGTVVDGSNNVYFFSGIPQHAFDLAATPLDITAYGGDGDSIAILPSGDETVVSGDNGAPLVVISGILSGNPVIADTIVDGPDTAGGPTGGDRDGLVISNDGKTLLSRGLSGLDVFSVAHVAAHPGSTGMGTTSYTFTRTSTLNTTVPAPSLEDGRDGMAISPADSSRAVVAGSDPTTGTPEVVLLTGLPSSATVSAIRIRMPAMAHHRRPRTDREPSTHRVPYALVPPGVGIIYAVTISPSGKVAYLSTDAGIIAITGIDTGNLAQSGAAYFPAMTLPAGSGTCVAENNSAPSIGVLPDGKYLVAVEDCNLAAPATNNTNQGSGVLVTIPIGSGGTLGPPVGQLNYLVTPFNDQIIFH